MLFYLLNLFLGPAVIFRSEHLETIYKLLEKRIAEDPIMEVRLSIGKTIKDLMLFERVHAQMNKYRYFRYHHILKTTLKILCKS